MTQCCVEYGWTEVEKETTGIKDDCELWGNKTSRLEVK